MTNTNILIIGAGLSGLMTATTLRQRGDTRDILIVDKGRSVGGRLATRRIGPGRADHGAQFFTVRSDPFREYVDRWQASGLVYKWAEGWAHELGAGSAANGDNSDNGNSEERDGHPRYAVRDGFNQLAKELAAELETQNVDIQTSVRIAAVTPDGNGDGDSDGWQLTDEQGNVYAANTLVITSPVPQTLALLDAGGTQLSKGDRAALERIEYDPCLCGLFWIEGEVDLPEPGAVQRQGETFQWIADNQRKGISSDAKLITLHADPDFSARLYEEPDEVVLPPMREQMEALLGPGASIREGQVKRWRYSQPKVLHDAPYLRAANLPPLYFGGDAFDGARVEGAALSGMSMGEVL